MGSIYKRKNSRYFWIKYYRGGKPFRESTGTDKERLARQLLKKREGQIAEGRFQGLQVNRIKFDELAEDFLTDYRINNKKSLKNAEDYVLKLKQHFGGMRVIDITSDRINAFIMSLKEQGKANGTINRHTAAIKRMFNLGARAEPPKV